MQSSPIECIPLYQKLNIEVNDVIKCQMNKLHTYLVNGMDYYIDVELMEIFIGKITGLNTVKFVQHKFNTNYMELSLGEQEQITIICFLLLLSERNIECHFEPTIDIRLFRNEDGIDSEYDIYDLMKLI